MDTLRENQALQTILGFDNPGLDLPSDFDEIVFNKNTCAPESAAKTLQVFPNSMYLASSGRSFDFVHQSLPGQGQRLSQEQCHENYPKDQESLNGYLDQQHLQQHYNSHRSANLYPTQLDSGSCLSLGHQQHQESQFHPQLQQQNHLYPQQKQSQLYQQQQQQSQLHPQPQQQNHLYHQQKQNQLHQQQQQNQSNHQQKSQLHHHQQQQSKLHHEHQVSKYCSIVGQPQVQHGSYDSFPQNHSILPDSPPDSGSEPYSPSDMNLHMITDIKSSVPGILSDFSPSTYLDHMKNRVNTLPEAYSPSVYVIDPINNHQKPQPQLQQNQQQLHRLPISNTTGRNWPMHQMSTTLLSPATIESLPDCTKSATKKRKYSESPPKIDNRSLVLGLDGVLNIKQEAQAAQFPNCLPGPSCDLDSLLSYEIDFNGCYTDGTNKMIQWQPYCQSKWAVLTDGDLKDLPPPHFKVDADKGFNFSATDEAFVCQKKNHFQVTIHMCLYGNAKYVRTKEGIMKIESFYLHVYGLKMEAQDQMITIEQSQSDRSKKKFHPFKIDLTGDKDSKVTLVRLHFSETTSNNMRKKGKPNPDQHYFLLVASLNAHSGDTQLMLVGNVSERIIVRASNPGQFESDADSLWQKGQNQEMVYHLGKVGINTDHPEEALTVHGNLRLTGNLIQPSDIRAKENIQEINPKSQLKNVSKLKIYNYKYKDKYAAQVGIPASKREGTGVLAQEVLGVLPDAVQEIGDVVLSDGEKIENFLVVNKDRIFMENVGAVKELCKLTDNLGNRIDQLEKMNKRLRTLKRFDSLKSTASSQSTKSVSTVSNTSSITPKYFSPSLFHATAKTSQGNSHHSHRSFNNSQGKSVHGTRSNLNIGPASKCGSKICRNWIGYVVFGLVSLMAFCLIALACLYILELEKSDSSSNVVSITESNLGMTTTLNTSLAASTSPSTAISTTFVITKRVKVTPTKLVYPPILPPYPSCTAGYCEVLCCPAPHEEDPNIQVEHGGKDPEYTIMENNNSGPDGEEVNNPNNGRGEQSTSQSSLSPTVETVITRNNHGSKKAAYNVVNIIAKNLPSSSMVSQIRSEAFSRPDNRYRRRRESDTTTTILKPTIQILELNYTITNVFCDVCADSTLTYFYYVPYNSSFGYNDITVKLMTQTPSYLGLCSSNFMWRCPMSEQDDTEIGGLPQQMTEGSWKIKIGNHFRTILNFIIIYSLKDKPVKQNETCSIQNGKDYIVLNYTITFQRECS